MRFVPKIKLWICLTIYRLNWANVEIKMNGYERIVNESILYFSRLAVEWVVQDGKSMDDIVIHT